MSEKTTIPTQPGQTMLLEVHSYESYTTIEAWHIANPQIRYICVMVNGTISKWYRYSIEEAG